MIRIAIANEQSRLPVNESRLKSAVQAICQDAGLTETEISLAIVDDPTIHRLNRQYLEHDYPTDVISFVLEADDGRLEGEVIASSDTAVESAQRLGWNAEDELLLYVIHGVLHLVGYDDVTEDAAHEMRQQERHYLSAFGLVPPTVESAGKGDA